MKAVFSRKRGTVSVFMYLHPVILPSEFFFNGFFFVWSTFLG